jgi:hypothetical protein
MANQPIISEIKSNYMRIICVRSCGKSVALYSVIDYVILSVNATDIKKQGT